MTMRVNRIRPLAALPVLAGLTLLASTVPAGAVPQIESTYGGQSPWYAAELNAMAGAGTAAGRGGLSNLLNPAGLAWTAGRRLDAGFTTTRHEENRFVPVFDSFESYVTDMAIASNQHSWLGGSFGLAVPLDLDRLPAVVGLSLADRYPYQYRFDEELRDPSPFSDPRDRILEEREYEVTGALQFLSLGIATEPVAGRLAVGAAVHYGFGDHNETWLVRDNALADGDQSYDRRQEWTLSGVAATFGVQGKVHERLALGVAYETRLSADGDYVVTEQNAGEAQPTEVATEETLKYPAEWRFGAAFYPRSDPRTTFLVDVVYTDWTKLADSRSDEQLALEDVVDVRIGLEHTFLSDTRLRFGFRRYDSYATSEGGNSVYSAGAGFPLLAGELSVSLELNKVASHEPHIFGYPADYVAYPEARVEDSRTRFGLGWSREF
ncbi:MAG TPA: hypothetical protein PLL30_10115 [Candidatus Krumholzibacteria bacterium]|nr:hypothetical protein [Candidatus Krumholzibacteria bacterium]HPD72115.1 hypothetical protein [Candidatus Krumholzibacteria bacterium]HRY40953.1 hypothetical protein [Candidatus Krumholzibacteria bacterium]